MPRPVAETCHELLAYGIESPRSLPLRKLAALQERALHHLAFNVTLACPLRCAHCIANSGPERVDTFMPLELASDYAGQMRSLFDYGVKSISLTGGEPLCAPRQLKILSDAAGHAGIECGLVTSGYWASDSESARTTIASLPHVGQWDVSTDIYHLEHVPIANVRVAYETIKAAGRECVLRVSHHIPLSDGDRRVLESILAFADKADIDCQRIHRQGRGAAIETASGYGTNGHPLLTPCLTQGPLVSHDGAIAPCCVRTFEGVRLPFRFLDASTHPLVEVHRAFRRDPFLQLLRTLGFGTMLEWLVEAGLDSHLPLALPEDVCDLCRQLLHSKACVSHLLARVGEPANRLKIGMIARDVFGDEELLQSTLCELGEQVREVEGFEHVLALAKDLPGQSPVCRGGEHA